MDILLKNAQIITLNDNDDVIPEGALEYGTAELITQEKPTGACRQNIQRLLTAEEGRLCPAL